MITKAIIKNTTNLSLLPDTYYLDGELVKTNKDAQVNKISQDETTTTQTGSYEKKVDHQNLASYQFTKATVTVSTSMLVTGGTEEWIYGDVMNPVPYILTNELTNIYGGATDKGLDYIIEDSDVNPSFLEQPYIQSEAGVQDYINSTDPTNNLKFNDSIFNMKQTDFQIDKTKSVYFIGDVNVLE